MSEDVAQRILSELSAMRIQIQNLVEDTVEGKVEHVNLRNDISTLRDKQETDINVFRDRTDIRFRTLENWRSFMAGLAVAGFFGGGATAARLMLGG